MAALPTASNYELPQYIINSAKHLIQYFDRRGIKAWQYRGIACGNVAPGQRIDFSCDGDEDLELAATNITAYFIASDDWQVLDLYPAHRAALQQPDPEANCVYSVDSTLAERGTNYGEFNDFAEICQGLTLVAREQPGWDKLSNPHREALEMIIHKISRVLNGNPNYKDSWHDIQGYAKLAEDACEE